MNSKYPQRRKTPSFSSSLLDSIFRSIDESNGLVAEEQYKDDLLFHRSQTTTSNIQTKQCTNNKAHQQLVIEQEVPSLRRAIMIDKWMENRSNISRNSRRFASYSTCSDSSSGATFSSSETESVYRSAPRKSFKRAQNGGFVDQTPKREVKFMKSTRLKALKIYGDLKKVKQPISPGGRISNLLNSIFTFSRYVKKAKIEETMMELKKSRSVKDSRSSTTTTTMCSSFSRSCLSKTTPCSRGNIASERSVRFYPDHTSAVVVDQRDPSLMPMPKFETKRFLEKNYATRENVRSYNQVKNMNKYGKFLENEEDDEEDNEEDDESCASSDLFELEIVGGVGIGAYREASELPVFETTNLRKNQAIANALIL